MHNLICPICCKSIQSFLPHLLRFLLLLLLSTTCFFIQYRFSLEAQHRKYSIISENVHLFCIDFSFYYHSHYNIRSLPLTLQQQQQRCVHTNVCSFQNEMDLNGKKWADDKKWRSISFLFLEKVITCSMMTVTIDGSNIHVASLPSIEVRNEINFGRV